MHLNIIFQQNVKSLSKLIARKGGMEDRPQNGMCFTKHLFSHMPFRGLCSISPYQNWRSCFHALVFDRHDVSPSADKWSLMIDAFSGNLDGFSLSSIIKSNLKEYEFYFTYLKIFMHWVRAWPWRMWNQEQSWSKKELHSEGVMVAIVGGFEFEIHKINCSCSAWDEENLHAGIVDAEFVTRSR